MSYGGAERPLHDTGLRRFAQLVYNVVAQKKRVSYQDVADDIILELRRTGTNVISSAVAGKGGGVSSAAAAAAAGGDGEDEGGGGGGGGAGQHATTASGGGGGGDKDGVIDDRTVRRRVYDSLNVLAALGHIQKEGKYVSFRSQPESALEEMQAAASAVNRAAESTVRKRAVLRELILQQLALRRLVNNNKDAQAAAMLRGTNGGGGGGGGGGSGVTQTNFPGGGSSSGTSATDVNTSASGSASGSGGIVASSGMGPPPGSVMLPFLLLAAPANTRLRVTTPANTAVAETIQVELDCSYALSESGDVLRMMKLGEFAPADLRRYVPPPLHRLVLRNVSEPAVDLSEARSAYSMAFQTAAVARALDGSAAVGSEDGNEGDPSVGAAAWRAASERSRRIRAKGGIFPPAPPLPPPRATHASTPVVPLPVSAALAREISTAGIAEAVVARYIALGVWPLPPPTPWENYG